MPRSCPARGDCVGRMLSWRRLHNLSRRRFFSLSLPPSVHISATFPHCPLYLSLTLTFPSRVLELVCYRLLCGSFARRLSEYTFGGCSRGCPSEWLDDGICDEACNVEVLRSSRIFPWRCARRSRPLRRLRGCTQSKWIATVSASVAAVGVGGGTGAWAICTWRGRLMQCTLSCQSSSRARLALRQVCNYDGKDCFHNAGECWSEPDGKDYRGKVSVTRTGKACQVWSSQIPWHHTKTMINFPSSGLGGHNFCRNPDGEDGCVLSQPGVRCGAAGPRATFA